MKEDQPLEINNESLQELYSMFSKSDTENLEAMTDINNLLLAISSMDRRKEIVEESKVKPQVIEKPAKIVRNN